MTMASKDRSRRARVARKLIDESPPKPRKLSRKRELSGAGMNNDSSLPKRLKSSVNEDTLYPVGDASSTVDAKSFYGKKKSYYVTPLERKAKRESQESSDSQNSDVNMAPCNAKSHTGRQHRKKRADKKPLSEIKPGSPFLNANGRRHSQSSSKPETVLNGNSEMKFFKSKNKDAGVSTDCKKVTPTSAGKMTKKGLKMVYKPASLKHRVTPSSPDLNFKKRSIQNRAETKPRLLTENCFISSVDHSDSNHSGPGSSVHTLILESSARRSPRKQLSASPANNVGSESRFSNQTSLSNTSDNVSMSDMSEASRRVASPTESIYSVADSVLLLSEIDSESNKSPVRKSNRIHPFFRPGTPNGLKGSPASSKSSTPQSKTSSLRSGSPMIRASKHKDNKDQYIIDAGQKLIGAVNCSTCGMTYNIQDNTDNATHDRFHTKVVATLKFPGWKNERVVRDSLDGSRIIAVMPDEKKAMKKVNAVKRIVDEDLGFVVDSSISPVSQVYMYISPDKRIVGFCIAEKINSAYRMIAGTRQSSSPVSPSDNQQPWCCHTEPEAAKCGINRIWVLKSERRCGIAAKLLESVRCNFMMGYVLTKADLAFTDPTPDGRNFAASYTETPSFLVYKHSYKSSY